MSESSIPGHFSREVTPKAELTRLRFILVLLSLSTLTAEAEDAQTSQGTATPKSFEPFLKKHCDRCHGTETQEADLGLHNMTRVIKDSADAINCQDTRASGSGININFPPSANPMLQDPLPALRQAASTLNVNKMRGVPYGLNEPFKRAIKALTGEETYYRW